MDGGWSDWNNYVGDCDVNCDRLARALRDPAQIDPIPKLSRFRECNAPAPRNGGRRCDGPAEEWKDCPVNCARQLLFILLNLFSESGSQSYQVIQIACLV